LRFARPLILFFNLLFVYLIIKETGIKTLSIFIVLAITFHLTKELLHFFYLSHFEKKIIKPIDNLKKGVEQVAQGNYNVILEYEAKNEIGSLIDSFNIMAKKLEENERIKREYEENRKALIANISHDLKTPISSIQGYLEAILEGAVVSEDKVKKYLEIAYNNTQYVNKLMDDLFLFSRLDIQKVDFHFALVNVKAFMKDLIQESILELEEKNIKVNYQDEIEKDCYVLLDGKRINQAVRNIIGNSVKHGPEKGLVIDVSLKRLDNFIHLQIEDNGPGIPEEKIPYIFDRFYRVEPERTKDFISTGLGLAISRELIEAHNGRIEAGNKNNGLSFKIILPIKDVEGEVVFSEKSSDN